MEVKHLVSKETQTITKEDWDVIVREGLADRFQVIDGTDFTPPETLSLPGKNKQLKAE